MKKQLLSFHGKQEIKDAKIVDLQAHKQLDNLKKGAYWTGKKGCAVTCTMFSPEEFANNTVDTSDIHGRYETQLGIPRIIAKLEDRIFEGLPVAESKDWPLNFIEAIPVGVDLKNVWPRFMIWLLVDEAEGVIRHAKTDDSRQAIKNIADAFERSLATEIPYSEWAKLREAARSYAAADAAYADAAYAAYAAAAYAYAAYADAAAAYAAYADAYADAAADAAAAAAAREQRIAQAKEKARQRKYIKMSEKMIELLKAA